MRDFSEERGEDKNEETLVHNQSPSKVSKRIKMAQARMGNKG